MKRLAILAGLLLLPLLATSPEALARGGQPRGPGGDDVPPPLDLACAPVGEDGVRATRVVGGGGGGAFEARAPEGALLVGVRGTTISWAGHEIVRSLQPLYRAEDAFEAGAVLGVPDRAAFELLARPGYAVGALLVQGGHRVDGLALVFQRVEEGRLVGSDAYTSPWVGGRGGGSEQLLGGLGHPVVGLVGRAGADLDALGLLERAPSHPAPDRPPARLAFSGRIDGSERIVIAPHGARWENVYWGTPDAEVTLGGVAWNPRRTPFLPNEGATRYLPAPVDFASARLVKTAGRDTVSIEKGPHGVTVRIADNPNGSDLYAFSLLFDEVPQSPCAELSLHGTIDGSEEIVITTASITWRHLHWGWPPEPVFVNDATWDPRAATVLANEGDARYLPPGVDLSTARVVRSSGRDLCSVEVLEDRIVVHWVDTPVGVGAYEVVLRFGTVVPGLEAVTTD